MSSRKEAQKVFRTALIGCGGRGISLAVGAKDHGRYTIVAVADPLEKNRQQAKQSLKQPEIKEFGNYRELLKWGEFDVAIITSPDFAHEEQAIACMKAGKDLLLEKPIAISIEGGKRVVETAKKTKRIVIVGFVLRYATLFAKAKEFVDKGTIGDLTAIWVLHSVASGSDWYFHDWHGTVKNTGGLLLQKGSHDFDIINWFADSPAKMITALGSQDVFGGNKPNTLTCPECSEKYTCPESLPNNAPRVQCVFRKEVDCLDNHIVLMQFANGVKATYTECHYTPDNNREYIFVGTKGKLKLDDNLGKLFIYTRPKALMIDKMEYQPGSIVGGHGGGDPKLFFDLAEAIDKRTQPLASVQAGLDAIRVGLLAHKSIRQGGKPIRVKV
jgi:predicted dehydrogenase